MQPTPDLIVAERFRLVRILGRGGMGSVWLAQHLGLDTPCAVKFIEGEYAQLPEAQARFGREAKAAAALRSPHVVQILDHGVWRGTPYMAMELLEGEDLGKRLARVGRMPPRDLCAIIAQVTRALTKAHAAGIVHRDLKPDNIFLVHDDDREIAKVLDFGIAKQSTVLEGGATKTGAMLGTPYYMSPEQAQGVKAVDHRSDLWSLAVIVYQALTGQLPFESEALGDLLLKIIVAPIPVPSQIVPDLPQAFDHWWAKAASRDPSQRYQSARELLDGLTLVFGQSQATDVMDRAELRAAMGQGVGMASGSGAAAAAVSSPRPYGAISTGSPGTHGAGTGQPGSPQMTPNPALSPSGQHVITGESMVRTFGDASGPVRSKAPIYAIAAASVVMVALAALGGGMALKSSRKMATASETAVAPSIASEPSGSPAPPSLPPAMGEAVPPPSSASLPSAEVAIPPPAQPASATSPSALPVAPAVTPRAHGSPAGGAVAPAVPTGKAAPAKPVKKPADVDLGI